LFKTKVWHSPKPVDIFHSDSNSDQGSQFTSDNFTGVLKREDIAISMGGRGRAYDNIFVERLWRSVKYEDVYLHGYSAMGELLIGLTKYFAFYNAERPHQSLGNQTPQEVHETSSGGGAMIVDKYCTKERLPVALRSSGAALEEVKNNIWPAISNATTGAAPSSCEKSSAT
jgi:putative transposase